MRPNEPDEVPAAAAFHPDARTKQRCAEYEVALGEALRREMELDACLDEALLLEVAPHPDVTSVLVVVVAPASRHVLLRDALERARERMRQAIAARIAGEPPELTFAVMPPPDVSS
ncbi:hypothetical protein [Sandaracinus amylolyticus]|uniref:hypothetical protein n=1 Tax=Sandaracinus amylolyticus TaxID=927083 RepID=UPI001F357C9E|nr:hypothetical protein [Sandaracinus amylolyticus]UJR82890.1 Hypothetical protein I5071_49550 [Sandaracinus amylolyticus]